jgi:hypothetical protein
MTKFPFGFHAYDVERWEGRFRLHGLYSPTSLPTLPEIIYPFLTSRPHLCNLRTECCEDQKRFCISMRSDAPAIENNITGLRLVIFFIVTRRFVVGFLSLCVFFFSLSRISFQTITVHAGIVTLILVHMPRLSMVLEVRGYMGCVCCTTTLVLGCGGVDRDDLYVRVESMRIEN